MQNNFINEKLKNAVNNYNLEEVKALLSAGADATLRISGWGCDERDTLLHKTSSVEITKALLLGGAYVNANNMYRETPLHTAITTGKKLELVRELLKHGANVNETNRKGNTALNHAVKRGTDMDIVQELLKYGADINIRNREVRPSENYNSSLDNAVNKLPCAKMLIKFTLIRNFNKDYRKNIDLSPYSELRNYAELTSYLDDCVSEVVQMKTDKIKDGLTLYEFVTNSVPCNQLSVRLAKIDFSLYSLRYPIYNDIILDKLKLFLERVDLLHKLSQIQIYTKLDIINQDVKGINIILDNDSTYNITKYLSNDDLLNFILAFDDSNEHTIQSLYPSFNLIESGKRLFEPSTSTDTKRARLE